MPSTFDTHGAVRRLEAAGVRPPAAQAIVTAIADAEGSAPATKADFEAFTAGLRADLAAAERRALSAGLVIAGLLFAALRLSG